MTKSNLTLGCKKRGGYMGGRSRKGCPNRTTQDAREVVTRFVEGNLEKLQMWLDQIAEGTRDESGKYITRPDPAKAFEMMERLFEYHIPKLSRVEMNIDGEVFVKTFNIRRIKPGDEVSGEALPCND